MMWNIRDGLRDSLVAAAPYGGPIGTNTPLVVVVIVVVGGPGCQQYTGKNNLRYSPDCLYVYYIYW